MGASRDEASARSRPIKAFHHRDTEKTFFNLVILSGEETEGRSFLAVEGPLLPTDGVGIGVLRLRECFAPRN